MGQTLSVQEPYIPPLILAFPWELIITITMLIEHKNFEVTLAKTCKTLYGHYEQHYEDKTAVVLCDLKSVYLQCAESIKALQLHHGWLRLKFFSIREDSQSSKYPMKNLCLNQELKILKESDYVCTNALIIASSIRDSIKLTTSFVEKFSNLKSLSLISVTFNNDVIVSTVPKLSFLEFISLDDCKMASDHLKTFENYTALQEIQLKLCKFPLVTLIELPSHLKRFKIEDHNLYELNASKCTRLESL
jgi:hypothetical protein